VGCPHGGDRQPGADRPSWEGADIFRLSGNPYRQTPAVSAVQPQVIDALMAWRTAQLGGPAERGPQGGLERSASSSCRNRPCPQCQTWATAQGVEAQRAAWLPTPDFHTGFPVPHALTTLLLDNHRLRLTRLCRTVSQTLLQCGQQHLGGHLGAPMVLHTGAQTLNAHCHLPGLGPAGAWAEDGPRGVPTPPRGLLPVWALSTVCRAKVLTALPQAYNKAALRFAQGSARCDSSTGFPHLRDQR
jgi:Transposase zinc-binding domain/Putative transposase